MTCRTALTARLGVRKVCDIGHFLPSDFESSKADPGFIFHRMGAIIILTGFPREYRIEYRWDEEEKEWHVTCPTFPQLDLRRPSFEMAVDHAELVIRKYWLVSYFDRHIFTFHHVPMVDEWTEEEDEFADPAKVEANADGGDGK